MEDADLVALVLSDGALGAVYRKELNVNEPLSPKVDIPKAITNWIKWQIFCNGRMLLMLLNSNACHTTRQTLE